jgi:N-carbamoylputrescine amidase
VRTQVDPDPAAALSITHAAAGPRWTYAWLTLGLANWGNDMTKKDDDRLSPPIQCALDERREINVARVVGHIRDAAKKRAQVILAPELFEGPYFPREEDESFFDWARPLEGNETLQRLSEVAKELGVVIPYSWFEKAGQAYYNSLAMIDADGEVLGVYRKSHIPEGPGYHEKFYFSPGDSGFRQGSVEHPLHSEFIG